MDAETYQSDNRDARALARDRKEIRALIRAAVAREHLWQTTARQVRRRLLRLALAREAEWRRRRQRDRKRRPTADDAIDFACDDMLSYEAPSDDLDP